MSRLSLRRDRSPDNNGWGSCGFPANPGSNPDSPGIHQCGRLSATLRRLISYNYMLVPPIQAGSADGSRPHSPLFAHSPLLLPSDLLQTQPHSPARDPGVSMSGLWTLIWKTSEESWCLADRDRVKGKIRLVAPELSLNGCQSTRSNITGETNGNPIL